MKRLVSVFSAALLLSTASVPAAESADPDARLRESLKATMLQLRNAEAERTALQASQAAAADQIKQLTAQVQALTRHAAEDKAITDKTVEELKTNTAALAAELASTKEALAQSQQAHARVSAIAKTEGEQRAKLEAENAVLQRLVTDREVKNLALYRVATEILGRFEKFGLGDAIAAREPFVGLTRVRLENLVQDYRDKLDDQRLKQP
jgi:DNA repair exonuclease SbcCD ATPase subunit